jgi:cytochrome c biogenesis protein CcmG, thiol:disulfide interchange protein DsbE
MEKRIAPGTRKPFFLTLITAGVFLIGAALIPLLVSGQQRALNSSELINPPIVMDQAAPNLSLTDLQGNPVSLSLMRGKVVLLNNWATWCPPCQAEMPELQAYYHAHSLQSFTVVAIESGEPADTVTSFVQQYELTFPVWLDLKSAQLAALQNWDLPSSYVIDRQGIFRMRWTGPVNQAILEKYVTPLLLEASK